MRQKLYSLMCAGLFGLTALSAHAATLSLSPSGSVSDAGRVNITASVSHGSGASVGVQRVTLNDVDVTQYFGGYATITPGATQTNASIGVPLGAGTYTFAMTVTTSEGNVSGSTTFTVAGDDQSRRRNMVISRINTWMHQWDEFHFASAVNLGNIQTFRNRIEASEVQVFVDASYLDTLQSVAAYVESWVFPFYWRDLVLAVEPESFANDGSNNSGTLWHEMIHAISHGAGGMGVDDHILIGWAEQCTGAGFNWLRSFEQYAAANSYRDEAAIAGEARTRWKKFLTSCGGSTTHYGRAPTASEIASLGSLTGISINPQTIKSAYRSRGYPASYFDDVQVVITSPANNTETADNQVVVQASVTVSDPSITIPTAGFVVNGATQQAPLTMSGSSGTFQTTAVLKTGDNDIYAGVVTGTGDVFTSSSINVKSTALLNTYHIRITWDKNDTDVDIRFSWSGGSTCYYGNKQPTWGSSATSPRLDVDDTNGYGPENITIDALPGAGHYKAWVNYYSDHGNGATTVNATVYQNGSPIFSQSKTITSGENWTLLEFDIQ